MNRSRPISALASLGGVPLYAAHSHRVGVFTGDHYRGRAGTNQNAESSLTPAISRDSVSEESRHGAGFNGHARSSSRRRARRKNTFSKLLASDTASEKAPRSSSQRHARRKKSCSLRLSARQAPRKTHGCLFQRPARRERLPATFSGDTLVAKRSELIFRGRMIAICALFRVPWIDEFGEHGG